MIAQKRQPCEAGQDLLDSSNCFLGWCGSKLGDPRDISTGPIQRSGEPSRNGVDHRCEDDGNLTGYVLNSPNPDRAECNDDVYIETDEFGGKRRNSVELSFGNSRLDQNVAALDISPSLQMSS